jgi:hypothetical protein
MKEDTKKALIDQYKAMGGVAFLPTPNGTLAFKAPPAKDYERFQDKLARNKGESSAMRELVLCCMIHPQDQTAGIQILDRYVAVIPIIIQTLQTMAGQELELELKLES